MEGNNVARLPHQTKPDGLMKKKRGTDYSVSFGLSYVLNCKFELLKFKTYREIPILFEDFLIDENMYSFNVCISLTLLGFVEVKGIAFDPTVLFNSSLVAEALEAQMVYCIPHPPNPFKGVMASSMGLMEVKGDAFNATVLFNSSFGR